MHFLCFCNLLLPKIFTDCKYYLISSYMFKCLCLKYFLLFVSLLVFLRDIIVYHIWAIHLPLHFVVTVIFCNLFDVLMQKVTCFTFFSLSFSLLFFLLLLVLIFFVDQMQQATVGSHSIYGVECSFAHSRKR